MQSIVPDEQRSNEPKWARRFAVELGSPLDGVAMLARGYQPARHIAPCQRASQLDHGVSP